MRRRMPASYLVHGFVVLLDQFLGEFLQLLEGFAGNVKNFSLYGAMAGAGGCGTNDWRGRPLLFASPS